MNIIESVFGRFDFSSINDPEFKEDAVREEIIAPLLRKMGYGSDGENKIVRSKSLGHPYVMFGTEKRRLKLIPDYVLSVKGRYSFVLDAKAPNQEITKGNNVAQVYSYAIHPEIRSWNYGLCNGRSLALYEITSIEPKRIFDLMNISESDFYEINQKLNPRTLSNNEILDYFLDGGTYLHFVMNLSLDKEITFTSVPIMHIGVVAEDYFSTSCVCTNMTDRSLCFTFDFDALALDDFLAQMPIEQAGEILNSLRSYPYKYHSTQNPPLAHISFRQASKPAFSQRGEMFFPMRVVRFTYDKASE